MLFNTWTFVAFLLVVFSVHYLAPLRGRAKGVFQLGWLIGSSLTFYGWQNPPLVALLGASLLLNGFSASVLLRPEVPSSQRRLVFWGALLGNLGALCFFKYAGLLAETLLPESAYAAVGPFLRDIPLPIGISFYTFAGLSLIINAYRRHFVGLESLVEDNGPRPIQFHAKIWFFVSFFPHLIAGPIVQANQFVNQIEAKFFRDIDWNGVVRHLVTGFFLKMVVADNLKETTAALVYPAFVGLPALNLLGLLYGFSCQIFADFAGYSLIAIGLGRLFGYQFPINFNFPYLSSSLTEFWRRWHITLSTWLRDYLYIPLGGNRLGSARTYLNLFLVMFLGGLWHGAAWSYAVWGSAHGLLLAIERLIGRRSGKSRPAGKLWTVVRVFWVFNAVSFLWLLFKLPKFEHVLLYLRELAACKAGGTPEALFNLSLFSLPVFVYHGWAALQPRWERLKNTHGGVVRLVEDGILAGLFFLILTNSGTPGEFIYFQF